MGAGKAARVNGDAWSDLLPAIARHLLGDPPAIEAGGSWRYGKRGSLAVHVDGSQRGTFRDFEAGKSGGVLDLVLHLVEHVNDRTAPRLPGCERRDYWPHTTRRRPLSAVPLSTLQDPDRERQRDDADARALAAVQLEALTADGQRLTAWPSSSSTREAKRLTTARDVFHLPQPAPVLWRDPDPRTDPGEVDAVLSVGEVAILASAGGLGKSCLTLALAVETATAAEAGREYGNACGLRVKAGGAVTRCDAWPRLWEEIKAARPSLVIVDPVSAALADADTSQTGPARTFLRLLSQEAATAGCGVLLVAHDTKSARNLAMAGQDPGAGAVAGSAAWYDGARRQICQPHELLRAQLTHPEPPDFGGGGPSCPPERRRTRP